MKKKIILPILLCSILSLSGCVTPPPVNFSPDNIAISTQKIHAEIKSISVTVSDEDSSEPIFGPKTTEVLIPQWKNALEDALTKSAIFDDDSQSKVSISVILDRPVLPKGVLTVEYSFTALYKVIYRKTGEIIFTTKITSSGVTPVGENFYGNTRVVKSFNRAGKNNIKKFISQLEQAAPIINGKLAFKTGYYGN